ncbi:MAG: universal stress protein [Deltaproteobacteria bacterium]|nr:universal stress protein [Deltaproteobacteria bacterium]
MTQEIKKILYATDISKNSAFAFQYATSLADKHNATICILHVMEEIPPQTKAMVEMYLSEEQREKISHDTEHMGDIIKSRLGDFCDRVQKDDASCVFRVERIEVIHGFPAAEILKKVDEFDCDIIVMGTHGKGIIGHAFLGSVAEKVLRRSTKPVFVIPLPKGEADIAVHDI